MKTGNVLQGKYRILSVLGQGGYGTVYQAYDLLARRDVAIKELIPVLISNADDRGQAVELFLREGATLSALSRPHAHPNLPRVYDLFQIGPPVAPTERHYLILEFVEGQNLLDLATKQNRVSHCPVREKEALAWGQQLCSALQCLHSQHPPLIYRDMKPENAILRPDGKIKLIDFGTVRVYKQGKRQDTGNLGTPGYASPEHYGRNQTDVRSDIYGLGATLYRLLAGYDPADAPGRIAAIASGSGDILIPLRRHNPLISPPTEYLIMQMLALSPQYRPASALHLQAELAEAEARLGSSSPFSLGSPLLWSLPGGASHQLNPIAAPQMYTQVGAPIVPPPPYQGNQPMARFYPPAQIKSPAALPVSTLLPRTSGSSHGASAAPTHQQPLYCQDCGRMNRLQAKHCASCGVALAAPTIRLTRLRPPGSASTKQTAGHPTIRAAQQLRPVQGVFPPRQGAPARLYPQPAFGRKKRPRSLWGILLSGVAIVCLLASAGGLSHWGWISKTIPTSTSAPSNVPAPAQPKRQAVIELALNDHLSDAAWSPAETRLATSAAMGNIMLYDSRTQHNEIFPSPAANAGEALLSWAPDGSFLLAAYNNGEVWRFSVTNKQKTQLFTVPYQIRTVAWQTGGIAILGYDGLVRVYSPAGRKISTLTLSTPDQPESTVQAIAWTPDGKTLIIAGSQGLAFLWKSQSNSSSPLLLQHPRTPGLTIKEISWAPDASSLAVIYVNGEAWIWKVHGEVPQLAANQLPPTEYSALAWSPTGRFFASLATSNEITVFSEPEKLVLIGKFATARWLAWSPDGRTLAAIQDKQVSLIQTALYLQQELSAVSAPSSISWAGDNKTLTFAVEGSVGIWDTQTKSSLVTKLQSSTTSLLLTPPADSSLMKQIEESSAVGQETHKQIVVVQALAAPVGMEVAFVEEDRITLWDRATGEKTSEIALKGYDKGREPVQVAWSSDGKMLAALGDGGRTAFVWSVGDLHRAYLSATAAQSFSIPAANKAKPLSLFWQLSWVKGQDVLALLTFDGKVVRWNAADNSTASSDLNTQDVPSSFSILAFSPDHTSLAAWPSPLGMLEIKTVSSPALVRYIQLPSANIPVSIAWSPDSKLIAVGFDTGQVAIVAATSTIWHELHIPTGDRITGLVWSPDSSKLAASWSKSPGIIVWPELGGVQ